MRGNWKDFDNRLLFPLVVFFIFGGIDIHRAIRFTDAMPNMRTTSAHNVYLRHYLRLHSLPQPYTCRYDFSVEGQTDSGKSSCPQISSEDSIKPEASNSVNDLARHDSTVYYDPSDPTINSLTEFGASSETEYRKGIWLIGLGVICTFPFVLLLALNATKRKNVDREFVDAKGTFIYPSEVNFGAEFGKIPNRSRHTKESYSATNVEAAKIANFASSHGLRELYHEVVKQIHPDLASSEADRALRDRLTKDANVAYERGDDATLRRVLEEYESPELRS